mmetsp:Transcript_3750/g.10838  ORF Transcript_3750/g.10838 Transcript_3750/m.10838 type:complete len:106 (+) Transcript_3750:170-487(+)
MDGLRQRSTASDAQSLLSKPAAPKRPLDPAPKGSIALGVVLLVLGSGLLLHGARHLAGHIIRTDGAGWGFTVLGVITFLPGAYVTGLAAAAWLGLEGYKYSDIPK